MPNRPQIRVRCRLREFIPGTDELAVVAAVNSVADERPEFDRDRTLQFDGEITDATSCIELKRRGDRAGRAGRHAGLAAAAVCTHWGVDRQRQIGVDLAQKKPRARIAGDKVGVLADPAESRIAGQGFLEHGSRVDVHAIAEFSDPRLDAIGKVLQRVAHDLVVVACQRIARDVAEFSACQHGVGGCGVGGPVIESHADRTNRPGPQLRRTRAARAVAGHVVHLAVASGLEPAQQMVFVFGEFEMRDSECRKPEFRGE